MSSKLDRRGNSIAFDIARYLENRKVRRDNESLDYRNLTLSDADDAYREIATVLLEAIGIFLFDSGDTYIETIEGNTLDKDTEKDAIVSILEDFSLFLKYGEYPEIAKSILRSFKGREGKFNEGVYSYDSRSESSGKVG